MDYAAGGTGRATWPARRRAGPAQAEPPGDHGQADTTATPPTGFTGPAGIRAGPTSRATRADQVRVGPGRAAGRPWLTGHSHGRPTGSPRAGRVRSRPWEGRRVVAADRTQPRLPRRSLLGQLGEGRPVKRTAGRSRLTGHSRDRPTGSRRAGWVRAGPGWAAGWSRLTGHSRDHPGGSRRAGGVRAGPGRGRRAITADRTQSRSPGGVLGAGLRETSLEGEREVHGLAGQGRVVTPVGGQAGDEHQAASALRVGWRVHQLGHGPGRVVDVHS